MANKKKMSALKKKGYLWVTLALFLVSIVGHWYFAWEAYKSEQMADAKPVVVSDYVTVVMRDTLENWQSEFLQLMWQICGLAYLLFVGSPDSKEGDDRKEEKLDAILRRLDPENVERILRELEEKYPKK
jgi:hypothetical protein